MPSLRVCNVISPVPSSQCSPVNPGAQSQVYELTASTHVAPFKHGSPAHSSVSTQNKNLVYTTAGGDIKT